MTFPAFGPLRPGGKVRQSIGEGINHRDLPSWGYGSMWPTNQYVIGPPGGQQGRQGVSMPASISFDGALCARVGGTGELAGRRVAQHHLGVAGVGPAGLDLTDLVPTHLQPLD